MARAMSSFLRTWGPHPDESMVELTKSSTSIEVGKRKVGGPVRHGYYRVENSYFTDAAYFQTLRYDAGAGRRVARSLPVEIHALLVKRGGQITADRIMTGVYHPDEGQILLDGKPIR
jgi:hypothetical protein